MCGIKRLRYLLPWMKRLFSYEIKAHSEEIDKTELSRLELMLWKILLKRIKAQAILVVPFLKYNIFNIQQYYIEIQYFKEKILEKHVSDGLVFRM